MKETGHHPVNRKPPPSPQDVDVDEDVLDYFAEQPPDPEPETSCDDPDTPTRPEESKAERKGK